MADDRLARAYECYERAVFGGEAAAVTEGELALDRVEAEVCLGRGRLLQARFLAEGLEDPRQAEVLSRAVGLFESVGDERGEAEASFWLGTYHQVVRKDAGAAVPLLEHSYALASKVGDRMTMSYAARHLGFVAIGAGRIDAARMRLEESLRLRQELGHRPATAAGLLALADLAMESGDRDDAARLLDEAASLATESGGDRILDWVGEARARLARSR